METAKRAPAGRSEARRYNLKGVAFAAPAAWEERTVLALAAPSPSGAKTAPNLVVTVEPLRDGDTLQTHLGRQLIELAKQLPDFEIRESAEATLGGEPARVLCFSWASPFGPIEQAMTSVERAAPAGRAVLTFTSTAAAADIEHARPVFAEILDSVVFSTPGAPTSDVAPRAAAAFPLVPMPGTLRPREV